MKTPHILFIHGGNRIRHDRSIHRIACATREKLFQFSQVSLLHNERLLTMFVRRIMNVIPVMFSPKANGHGFILQHLPALPRTRFRIVTRKSPAPQIKTGIHVIRTPPELHRIPGRFTHRIVISSPHVNIIIQHKHIRHPPISFLEPIPVTLL